MSMKVCIYGAGAIGGWIGVHLARQGCTLSAVARGATLAALQRQGLLLRQGGQDIRAEVLAHEDPAEVGVQDVVIVAVKAPAMADVARRMGPLLGPDTVVLTAMNGVPWWFLQGFGGALSGTHLASVDPGGVTAQHIPAAHIVGGVVHASCSVDAPGVIRHHFGQGLILGEPSGADTPRVQALVALLVQAGFNATVSPQIQKDVWYKLWGNMTLNPISAFTGATTDVLLDDPLVRDFVSRIMREAQAIGERMGLPMAQTPEDRHEVTRKLGAFRTSMLQDVMAGKPVELDALVAAVRELGQLTGVDTPFTDALLGLSRVHARGLGLYPAA